MRTNDSDLFFTCSLIELIGRTTCQKRSATVELLGRKIVSHVYANAGILHCEPIAKTAEKFIELTKIPQGVFDNVSLCKYDVPSYWTIGKVYSRLIEDVEEGDIIDALFKVYTSPISDDISNYNSDFFYQPRDFIKEQFLNWLNLNSKKTDKKPAIRFRGFTDSWEQRKLGSIVSPYIDPVKTPHTGYWRLGIRSHAKGTFHDYVLPGRELGTAKMQKVKADNLIVNITFAWEHAVAITAQTDAGMLVSHRFPQFSFSERMNPQFFKYVILDERFRYHLWLASPGGAGRNRVLKVPSMLEYKTILPQKAEQTRIASFFDDLDRLITLHQRE